MKAPALAALLVWLAAVFASPVDAQEEMVLPEAGDAASSENTLAPDDGAGATLDGIPESAEESSPPPLPKAPLEAPEAIPSEEIPPSQEAVTEEAASPPEEAEETLPAPEEVSSPDEPPPPDDAAAEATSGDAAQPGAPGGSGAASANPLAGLDLESLSATRTLPLFTPSRTAPIVEAPPEPELEPEPEPEIVEDAAPTPPALDLIGIVMAGTEEVALLSSPGTGEVHRLRPGDEYEGWKLSIVDTRTVEFRTEDQVHSLKMFTEYSAPPGGGIPQTGQEENMDPGMEGDPTWQADPEMQEEQMMEDPAQGDGEAGTGQPG